GGHQAANGRVERLRRARLRRGGSRRPELPLAVDEDRLRGTGDRRAAHPGEEGTALLAGGADPDRARLARSTVACDVHAVRTLGEVLTGPSAEREVPASGGVRLEGLKAGRGVVVALGVREERLEAGRTVVVADRVGPQRLFAGRGVVVRLRVQDERRRAER